jgi:hypothetical protein
MHGGKWFGGAEMVNGGNHERRDNKKGAAVAGGSKLNREASNRVDRSHSMST